MTPKSRWILFLVALVFIGTLFAWIDFRGFDAKPIAFNKKQWMLGRDQIKRDADPGCVLGGMALHLHKNNQLIQMPQQELVILLGSPNSGAGDKSLVWELGQCHGWGWKHSQLKITLDTTDRVKNVNFQELTF